MMLRDILFALRSFKRSPGFTVMVVAALTICIGANTAIFSIVNAVLLRPLNFPHQQQLVSLYESIPKLGWKSVPFSCPDYLFLAKASHSFQEMGTYHDDDVEVTRHGQPQRVHGERISASLFRTLGVNPALGRAFTEREDEQSQPLAVISDAYWRRAFAADPNVIGQTIDINRKPYTIIGVMPSGFSFPLQGLSFNNQPADIFIPVSWTKLEREDFGNMFNHSVVARLKPGVTVAQASAEVSQLLHQFGEIEPTNAIAGSELAGSAMSFREDAVGQVQTALVVLLGAVGLVLLIGCADVANLLLTRISPRQREFAIRAAVGASRARLIRQSLTESLLLSIFGGIAGLLLAWWSIPALIRWAPVQIAQLQSPGLDWRVLVFVSAVVLVAPLLFGLTPAFDAAKDNIIGRLSEGGRSGMQSRRHKSLMSAAVILQFALALVLLVSAGLLIRSFVRITQSDPGFQRQHILSAHVDPPRLSYSTAASVATFYDDLLQRLRQIPGNHGVAGISDLPFDYSDNSYFEAKGAAQPRTERHSVLISYTIGNVLSLLQVPLVRGRYSNDHDAMDTPKIVVVNQAFARQVWPGEVPIGHQVRLKDEWYTVVGVIGDVRQSLFTTQQPMRLYMPVVQLPKQYLERDAIDLRGMYLIVRTANDPTQFASALHTAVRQVDPSLRVTEVQTLEHWLNSSLTRQRFQTFLLLAFAGAALLLAILGIAGVLSYAVVQRTAELGIRMALGASQGDILKLILRHGLSLVCAGVAIGLIASLVATQLLKSLLYDTSIYDAPTFIAMLFFLVAVGIAAALLPAYHATRINPVVALRPD